MKISVIMPTYNGANTITESIKSILEQTHKDLELIIVDDGSTDNSKEIIKSIIDDRIKYFSQKNSGSPAGPRNLAISHATGELIALCDQDDIWYPEKLKKQVSAYEKSSDRDKIGIIYTQADFIDKEGKKTGLSEKPQEGFIDPEQSFQKIVSGNFIIACSAIFPLRTVKELGGFNENLHGNDEYDLWIRIAKKYGVLGIAEPLCAWRRTGDNFSANISRVYLENEKIFERLLQEMSGNEIIMSGKDRNQNRIISALILEKNYKSVKEYVNSPGFTTSNPKTKVLLLFFKIFPYFAYLVAKFLQKQGKISL
jgi:glycosyltransferase involved in cell wall biosynthesis